MGLSGIMGLCLGLLLWLGWPGLAEAMVTPPSALYRVEGPSQTQPWHRDLDQAAKLGDRCLKALQLDHYDEAMALCNQAIHLDANTGDYRLNRGIIFYRTGHFPEALADNTEVLAQDPDDFRGYYNRGLVQVALHNFEAAIDDFDRAAALTSAPSSLVDIYDDRGLAKLMAAQPQAALHDFEQALALDRDDLRALFNHGCACHQMGRLNEALADLNQILVLDPGHARTYLKRGLLRRSLGDQTGGVADLQQAADCARAQGELPLHHYILTLLNEWQVPITTVG